MTNGVIITITERARGVLALEEALNDIERERTAENDRYRAKMNALAAKQEAIEAAILKLGAHQ